MTILYRCEECGHEAEMEYASLTAAPESLPCCADIVPEPPEGEEKFCLYSSRRIGEAK